MNLRRLISTLCYLRPTQLAYQMKYRLVKAAYHSLEAPPAPQIHLLPCVEKPDCLLGETFCFLNTASSFHRWDDTHHGMLWAYNLNYMDWLGQASMTKELGAQWVDKFIAALPHNNVGLDPYPIALRGINWIKFMVSHGSKPAWNDSLYSQYSLLTKRLEYHLLGNHLLEDAFSLYIASIYFADEGFYKKASRILRRELKEQILPDGAHYEQSAMYHCILLDRLLDCYNVSFNNIRFEGQEKLNAYLQGKVELMLGHLDSICYSDDSIPLFNDAAYAIAPTARELRMYAQRLGITWQAKPLNECGYRRMQDGCFEAMIDVGNITASYQPGHSHADSLNYELRLQGLPFIVDTGISTYNKNERRQKERSTAAHNTVTIDERDSSEVWGGFRVGKRAHVKLLLDTPGEIVASHDGYGRRNTHTRRFTLVEGGLRIEDHLEREADAVSHIHLAPEIDILHHNDKEIVTSHATIRLEGASDIDLTQDFVSTQYNQLQPSTHIRVHFSRCLSLSIRRTEPHLQPLPTPA